MKKAFVLMLVTVLIFSFISAFGEMTLTVDELSSDRWFDTNSDTIFSFGRGGDYSQTYGTTLTGGIWELNNNVVSINGVSLELEYSENGIMLVGGGYALIQEHNYPFLESEIGGSLTNENISAHILSVSFENNWPDSIISDLKGPHLEMVELSDSQCIAKIVISITNLTKASIPLSEGMFDSFDVAIDYRDGFLYATDNDALYMMKDSKTWYVHFSNNSGLNGGITADPLEEKEIEVYMACPKILKEDEESPLKVKIYETISGKLNILQFPIR